MPVAMEIAGPSERFRARRHARELLRSMLERFGCLASVVVGIGGVAGFVVSEALLAAHRLPISAGSWCLALSLAVYGLGLGLGRLHEVMFAGALQPSTVREPETNTGCKNDGRDSLDQRRTQTRAGEREEPLHRT